MSAVDVDNLVKKYGNVTALQGISLSVEEGDVYGLLGPNGAGKSTLLSILLGYNSPLSGSVRVLGEDVQENGKEIRQRLGVLPEGFGVYGRLTARQHLQVAAQSKGVQIDEGALLRRVGLSDSIDRRAGGFSKGMEQRLALATALIGDPDILVLDEPTTGLDPNGARELREIVQKENDRGATVFFSSHILSQVEAVCDTVGVVQNGSLVVQDTIQNLREERFGHSETKATVRAATGDIESAVRSVDGVEEVSVSDDVVTILCPNSVKFEALQAIENEGATITNIETEDASLDNIFADITTGDTEVADDEANTGDSE